MPTAELRDTGIGVVGNKPWGTHFCYFCESKDDQLDILVPYFKAGLENKEFCVWVLSEPLTVQAARNALDDAIPGLNRYVAGHSIEMLEARDWYLINNVFDLNRVRNTWNEKLEQALARGYSGMRVSGNSAWLHKKHSTGFCEYEQMLNDTIADQPMTVLCTYPIDACGAAEVLDAAHTHQFVVAKRRGQWEVVEAPEVKQAKEEMKRLNEQLEQRVVNRTIQLEAVNEELRKEIIERQRSEHRLAMQYVITRVLTESDNLAVVTPHLLRAISERMGMDWGALWIVDRAAKVIRCQSTWHAENIDAADFETVSRESAFARGQGLPGYVWQSGTPVWIDDVLSDPRLARGPMAARAGLHGGIGFPILLGGQTLGIIELLSESVQQPDEEELTMLVAIGNQIGQFVERTRVEGEQRKLASLVEHSPDFIAFSDLNGQLLFINPAGKKMVGLKVGEEVRTTRMVDYVLDKERERFRREILPRVLRNGRWQGELPMRHLKTGAAIPMLHNIFFIRERRTDRPVAFATISRDITERKRAEEELRRSEAHLVEGQRMGHVGSWAWNISTGGAYCSQENFRIFGFEPGEIRSPNEAMEPFLQRIHPEDRSYVQQTLESAVRERKAFEHEFRIVLPDESLRHVHSKGRPVEHGSGEQVEFIGTVMDVTERKQAEEELRRSESYLAEGEKLSHTGSWVWNVRSGDLFWSQEHFQIFGVDPRKVKPSYSMFFDSIYDEDRPFVEQNFERAVRERNEYECAYRIVIPSGEIRHVHSLGHPVFNESGELIEFVGTVIDTTERRRAEEALKKAQAELAHGNRVTSMGELAASIAHEVNQPLGAIVTNGNACLRLLARGAPDLGKSREVIQRMIDEGLRASEVIKRIRALVMKNGTDKYLVNINEIVQEVLALTRDEAARNNIHVQTELALELPPVSADRIQLQQVILNLILNSKDAMSGEGWRLRELRISSRMTKSGEVLVSVKDTGPGLDPQDIERVFDAFFTTKSEGMGLGLSISRTIIESYGGRLWATPNRGSGATFQFTIPKSIEGD